MANKSRPKQVMFRLSEEEAEKFLEQVKAEVLAEYDRVLLIRKEFMERMHPGEEYEEDYI